MIRGTRPDFLVLGGTGFIGSHVSEALASRGARVLAVSRRGQWPWARTPPKGIQCASVDLTQSTAETRLKDLLGDASGIVNLAGALLRPGVRERELKTIHVEGTRRVLEALLSAPRRPLRLVHVSTTGVLGPTGPEPRDEMALPQPRDPYETTKLQGEKLALSHHGNDLEVVIVRPGLVYGPRDLHLLALYRSIRKGTFRNIAGGGARWQPVYVEDVARGIVEAVHQSGCAGSVLHMVGAEVVTVAEFSRKIAGVLGKSIHGPSLPYGPALVVGSLLEFFFRPFGTDPPLSRSRVRTLTEDRVYSWDHTKRIMGFSPSQSLDQGLAATVAWYRSHGYL